MSNVCRFLVKDQGLLLSLNVYKNLKKFILICAVCLQILLNSSAFFSKRDQVWKRRRVRSDMSPAR